MSTGQIELFGNPNFVAAGYLPRGARVTIDENGEAVLAGADERGYGTVAIKDVQPGEVFAVRPFCCPGVHLMIAAGAIPVGSKVVPAANGQVAAAGDDATNIIGVRAMSGTYAVDTAGDFLGVFPRFN